MLPLVMVVPAQVRCPGLSGSEGPVEVAWSHTVLQMGTLRLRDMVLDMVAQPVSGNAGAGNSIVAYPIFCSGDPKAQRRIVICLKSSRMSVADPSSGASSFLPRDFSLAPNSPKVIYSLSGTGQHKTRLPPSQAPHIIALNENSQAVGSLRAGQGSFTRSPVLRTQTPELCGR